MEHSKIINTINRFDGIISKIDYLDKEERFLLKILNLNSPKVLFMILEKHQREN